TGRAWETMRRTTIRVNAERKEVFISPSKAQRWNWHGKLGEIYADGGDCQSGEIGRKDWTDRRWG
ncbi:MAG TPA: hypothetical protein PLY86_17035, partial [bacterium]|nr:hypothetical protein [bacterium]